MPGVGSELRRYPASATTVPECAALSLKGSGKLFDLYPLIRPAGLAGARDSFGTRDCVQPEKVSQERVSFPKRSNYRPPRPTYPDEVSPRAAGVKRLEVGGDSSLKRLLSNQAPASELERFLLERREAVYRSTWTKPLGKSQIRGLSLSDATKTPNFRFGIKQTTDETNAAKKLIFPQDGPSNSEQDERLYQKSHRNYPPGKQVDRHYEVKHIDLRDFRFGKSYAKEVDGAKECLSGSRDAEGSTDESSKAVEDYRRIRYPEVGKPALSVAGNPDVPTDFAFGLVTHRDPATVEECLHGSYSLAEQQPDADLGRSRAFRALTQGFFSQDGSACLSVDGTPPSKLSSAFQRLLSNPAFQAQTERRFGVPSICTDIAPPKKRRIDDCVNYDDELSVAQLLTPAPFAAWGVSDEAFLIPRPRDKLLDLVRKSVGLSYADRPMLEQAVDVALGRKATEHPKTQEGSTQQVMASFMDVLNVFTRMLDERIAQETCSLTQTDRLRLF